jgi:hypothetical protein
MQNRIDAERPKEEKMEGVTTELDERFSEPGAEPTPWAETERTLRDAQLFWVSTVRRDGRPHVTPLVAVWLSGALHSAPARTSRRRSTWKPIHGLR